MVFNSDYWTLCAKKSAMFCNIINLCYLFEYTILFTYYVVHILYFSHTTLFMYYVVHIYYTFHMYASGKMCKKKFKRYENSAIFHYSDNSFFKKLITYF